MGLVFSIVLIFTAVMVFVPRIAATTSILLSMQIFMKIIVPGGAKERKYVIVSILDLGPVYVK
jgi:hypothetical protein